MKAFLINLERSKNRKKFMIRQLEELQISYEIVEGIDGSTLTDEYLSTVCDFEELAKKPYLLRRGVYGCALSHLSVYKRIIEENLECALVLEDDVELSKDLPGIMHTISSLELKNEVILLYSINTYMKTIFSTQNQQELGNGYTLNHPIDIHALGGAGAYIITNKAARGLLNNILPIRFAADAWPHFYWNKMIDKVRVVLPYPTQPAGDQSEIDYIRKSKIFTYISRVEPIKSILKVRRKMMASKFLNYTLTQEASKYY
ncbi:glycosyltransferase family 25 protein [Hymenobacter sp. BT188]|nr:glycosyltransferase family 25 protein [Hymenobacter sp. BT188]